MWRLAGRLLENAISVLEGLYIWCLGILGGLALGIGWAAREIFDTWTLEAPLKLIPDWRWVLRKAWSIKFNLIAAACAAAEVGLPLFIERFQHGWFAALSMGASAAGVIARLLAQRETFNVPTDKLPGAGQ